MSPGERHAVSRPVFARYLLLQIPGWAAVLLVLTLLRGTIDLSFTAAALVFALWVVKDLALFPRLRSAYEVDERTVVERLIGQQGAAVDELRPSGYVRVRGELWRAEVHEGHGGIDAGRMVVVEAVRDTVLLVTPRARHDLTPPDRPAS
jgi:membrane protein implicated in regulation of membrane protease activity